MHKFYDSEGRKRYIDWDGNIFNEMTTTGGEKKIRLSKMKNPCYQPNKVKNLRGEHWKKYAENNYYEYFISTKGRQKSRRYIFGTPVYKEKILKQRKDKDGYVMLTTSGKIGIFGHVHRLMAKMFLKDWDETLTVNHKNLKKDDNRIENLEMMTLQDNLNHGWKLKHDKFGWKSHKEKSAEKGEKNRKLKLDKYDSIARDREKGYKLEEIAKKYGMSVVSISGIICRHYPHLKKFHRK